MSDNKDDKCELRYIVMNEIEGDLDNINIAIRRRIFNNGIRETYCLDFSNWILYSPETVIPDECKFKFPKDSAQKLMQSMWNAGIRIDDVEHTNKALEANVDRLSKINKEQEVRIESLQEKNTELARQGISFNNNLAELNKVLERELAFYKQLLISKYNPIFKTKVKNDSNI